MGLISQANTQSELDESTKSGVNNMYFLLQVSPSGSTPQPNQLSFKEEHVFALQEITRLLELVIE